MAEEAVRLPQISSSLTENLRLTLERAKERISTKRDRRQLRVGKLF